jgi:flagellar biosynthetic protein FliP
MRVTPSWRRPAVGWAVVAAVLALGFDSGGAPRPATPTSATAPGRTGPAMAANAPVPALSTEDLLNSPQKVTSLAQTAAVFALVSLAPAFLLMLTGFVRISIVLTLLRQALGSPQVPGNQVITALALMLTALVMKPVVEEAYSRGYEPYAAGLATPAEALKAGTAPIKRFMVKQIYATGHQHYLSELNDYTDPPSQGRAERNDATQLDLRVVAPAFLISELTTALAMGFAIYLPFLVIDLVVSAVLAAMGLFMLPPTLVALPLKLIVFVLADGWMLVSGMLLRSFGG